jgi:hypothetical protein
MEVGLVQEENKNRSSRSLFIVLDVKRFIYNRTRRSWKLFHEDP